MTSFTNMRNTFLEDKFPEHETSNIMQPKSSPTPKLTYELKVRHVAINHTRGFISVYFEDTNNKLTAPFRTTDLDTLSFKANEVNDWARDIPNIEAKFRLIAANYNITLNLEDF